MAAFKFWSNYYLKVTKSKDKKIYFAHSKNNDKIFIADSKNTKWHTSFSAQNSSLDKIRDDFGCFEIKEFKFC